ncbi:MAG TPA: N-acetylmuramic acid 6-phosphate etherase [Candidatus Binatia bacterium]|nr:N-acetylmuramic acid 6-phosphate etherase [Candidatus Binatia bacterium]
MTDDLPPTEATNPRTAGLDQLDTRALVETLVSDHRAAVDAVLAQSDTLARVADAIAERLARGGRLHYVGAGSSGRIATLDASEMPPTFGTASHLVQAHVAGGLPALVNAIEGAEDDSAAGDALARERCAPEDAVVGLSASGGAAFVVAAVKRARAMGALTIAFTSVVDSALARAAEICVAFDTGAEALAGSTRLKAGTGQKIALNALSTAVMVRLGKVHGNLMVDVVASNQKLRRRALRLVCEVAGVGEERARELLDAAGGRVKVAIVMERRGVDAQKAQELLGASGGVLRDLI